jgi:DMSO reductase anchor subunit
MNSMELSLVFFTVLSQAAIGLVILSSVRQLVLTGPAGNVRREWLAAVVLLLVGMVASLFHLGHPQAAPMAIKHLSTAWLSREVLGVGLALGLMAAGFITAREAVKPGLALAAGAVGLLALFFMGMTYAPPGYPALNNALPFVFFLLTAAVLGTAFSSYFAPAEKQPLLARILGVSLLLALVIYLVAPCVWLSGGTVMQQTATAYLTSPLYWVRIVIGLAIPLYAVWRSGTIPVWVPPLILAGELIGRMAFFSLSVHASMNIGGL